MVCFYSLADYADEEDMHVGKSSKYVKAWKGTKNGQLSINASDSDITSSYAMTVCLHQNRQLSIQTNGQ